MTKPRGNEARKSSTMILIYVMSLVRWIFFCYRQYRGRVF